MSCHLLIPDLVPALKIKEFIPDARFPHLELLLSRGKWTHTFKGTMEEWLFNQFNVSKQQDWPVASLTLEYDGGHADHEFWLRADPIHLRLERGQLLLADNALLQISQEEADKLCHDLNQYLQAQNLALRALQPSRWYITLVQAPNLITHSISSAIGKHIDHFLPQGADKMRWQHVFNEIQMLLHEHPINQAREERGAPAINSVWFWGGGHYPKTIASPFSNIYSNEALSLSLAQASKCKANSLPENPKDLNLDSCLIVLDQLRVPAQYGDMENWYAHLTQLEENWFKALHILLSEKKLKHLILHTGINSSYRQIEVNSNDLWKFWRKRHPLTHWLN
jgi:hypothetical protein